VDFVNAFILSALTACIATKVAPFQAFVEVIWAVDIVSVVIVFTLRHLSKDPNSESVSTMLKLPDGLVEVKLALCEPASIASYSVIMEVASVACC
jgi:hypothetical protein